MTSAVQRIDPYLRLIRFDRPIGSFLLLWPCWWALWIAAGGPPSPVNLLVFTAGAFLMRSAGCAINDYADRDIDGHVERTRQRPIPAGEVSARAALVFAAALSAIAFSLLWLTNELVIRMSFVGMALAIVYPFMKRVTHLPQLVLGAAFTWGIPMAFAAEQGGVPAACWLLYCAGVAWTVVYDTFYAMVDRDDDLKIGVRSLAILLGDADRAVTATLQVLIIVLLVFSGQQFELGPAYYAGVAVGAGLFGWQQWLIRHRERQACFRAFLNNNLFGLAVFAGIAADYRLF